MKKYFILFLLSFVLVSCEKTEVNQTASDIKEDKKQEVSNTINTEVSQSWITSTWITTDNENWDVKENLVINEEKVNVLKTNNEKREYWDFLSYNETKWSSIWDNINEYYIVEQWKIYFSINNHQWKKIDETDIEIKNVDLVTFK